MSRFLKIIVNFIVFCAILVAVALLVPPMLGVNTVMIDDMSMDTNLPVGSVTYSKDIDVDKIQTGDKILVTEGSQTYAYEVKDMDTTAGSYTVADQSNKDADDKTLNLQNSVSKIVFTIPFIAYAAMALQSTEGLIIVGLAAVFLIILFVLAELWKKNDDEEEEDTVEEELEEDTEEDSEEEEDTSKSRRQLKKEAKAAKKAEKLKAKRQRQGYDDEEEDDDEGEEQEQILVPSHEPHAMPGTPEDVMQKTMESIAQGVVEATTPEPEVPVEISQTIAIPVEEVKAEAMKSIQQQPVVEVEPVQRKKEDVEKVLPTPKASELIAKATVNGEEPDIREDEDDGVTILDYTNIL